MKLRQLLAATLIPAALMACQHSPQSHSTTAASPGWDDFLAWWPGTYTNSHQTSAGTDASPEDAYEYLRLHIARIDNSTFGENAYYAEWQNADDPADVRRQRIYGFDREGESYVLRLHIFPRDEAMQQNTSGAHLDPAKLDGLTPDDMVDLKGCDVYFHLNGQKFAGEMRRGECAFDAPGDGIPSYSWSQMMLGPQEFAYLDGWFRATDDSLFQRFAPGWVEFRKED